VIPTFGIQTNPYTTTGIIPESSAVLLLGFGFLGLFGYIIIVKRRIRNLTSNISISGALM
jgi:hypothetical protein